MSRTKSAIRLASLAAGGAASMALAQQQTPLVLHPEPKPGSAFTQAAHRDTARRLPSVSPADLEDARRGLVAELGTQDIPGAANRFAWSLAGYEFLASDQPVDTVHPALWHHARLNLQNGLFKVTERVWQIRGADIANMTVVEGQTGLIVIDPLLSVETSRAALALYFQHRPARPVVAVIYTHSHADHFGGVRGVVSEQDVVTGKVQVIAPAGFMEAAIGENVMAGPVMLRRGHYQFGGLLPRGPRGHVDAGLGKAISRGNVTLIAPTRTITAEREAHWIDGVEIVFHLVPESEAPSEMIMHLPQFSVLNMAEIVSRHMHNLLPVRGAVVRDALNWSKQIGMALQTFGMGSDIMIMQHHWPVWGRDKVETFLRTQRDMYRYLHDQTVRLMNHGMTPGEIAERVQLPSLLQQDWSTHPFYGSVKHNVKAIYQRYVGWYDGHPANLDPLEPVAEAKKAIEYMGGAQAALEKARADFEAGEYRWVARVASQLVLTDPANVPARELAADTMEQLGYLAESSTMRNSYLQGARELRWGTPALPPGPGGRPDIIRAMPPEMYFDYLGVRLNAGKAGAHRRIFNWHFKDLQQTHVVELSNGALSAARSAPHPGADAEITLTKETLDAITTGQSTFQKAIASGEIGLSRGREVFLDFLGMLDSFPTAFPIVEPRSRAGL